MPRVVIRGTTPADTIIEIDGHRPSGVVAFRLLFPNPDELPILQLDIQPDSIVVDQEVGDIAEQRHPREPQRHDQTIEQLTQINAELFRRNERARTRIRELERDLSRRRDLSLRPEPGLTPQYPGPRQLTYAGQYLTTHARVEQAPPTTPLGRLEQIARSVQPPEHAEPTPRRRRRANTRWRQRYNEIYDEGVENPESPATRDEQAREQVRREMASGGDPDPGRVFPDAERGGSGDAVVEDSIVGDSSDAPIDATTGGSAIPESNRTERVEPSRQVVGVDPATGEDRSASSSPRDAVRANIIPARTRVMASRGTVQRLTAESFGRFVNRCRSDIGAHSLAVLFVERAEWFPDTNRVVWSMRHRPDTEALVRDNTHLIVVQGDSQAMLIVNESWGVESHDAYSPMRLSGGGALLRRFQQDSLGQEVIESQFVPEGTVLRVEPNRPFGFTIMDEPASERPWPLRRVEGWEGPADITAEDQVEVERIRAQIAAEFDANARSALLSPGDAQSS